VWTDGVESCHTIMKEFQILAALTVKSTNFSDLQSGRSLPTFRRNMLPPFSD
jgi:hypothetical protein